MQCIVLKSMHSSKRLLIKNLVIKNGKANVGAGSTENGGCLSVNSASVVLSQVEFKNCNARGNWGGAGEERARAKRLCVCANHLLLPMLPAVFYSQQSSGERSE